MPNDRAQGPFPDEVGAIHRGFLPPDFHPARWLRGPHAQTMGARQLRRWVLSPLQVRRERWETPDEDFIDLDFGPEPAETAQAPLVLILHGLEGSSERGYVKGAIRALLERGIASVAMNFRSCSGEPNRQPRFYHSGETEDLHWVLNTLAMRFPDRALGALGFSLGGNVMLKALGEGRSTPLRGAAAISVPFDLAAGTQQLENTMAGRLYARLFLKSLLEKVQAKAALLRPHLDLRALSQARSLREFDELATAPLHGFDGAREYYTHASSARYLATVQTPTILLHARDDPFLPESAIPEVIVAQNPWLLPIFPKTGGHVGFVAARTKHLPERHQAFWGEETAAAYLSRVLRSGP
jgi:predicted alpha/beta-fold hydrolase